MAFGVAILAAAGGSEGGFILIRLAGGPVIPAKAGIQILASDGYSWARPHTVNQTKSQGAWHRVVFLHTSE